MKKTTLIIVALMLAGVAGFTIFWTSPAKTESDSKGDAQLYTCGMHPQVVQSKPGDCPICGMKLQPIRKETQDLAGQKPVAASGESNDRKVKYYKSTMMLGEISQTPRKDSMGMDMVPVFEGETEDSATIMIDPTTVQTMGVRLGEVTAGPLRRSVRTVGVVDFNETALTDITTKFKGWIEKLFVDATGREVQEGEPLFEVYAPEIYNAELEYLSLVRSGNPALGRATLERIALLDVPADRIDALTRSQAAARVFTMRSPANGVVIEKNVVQGMMFEPGMNLFRLADLSIVWIKAQIYEQDMAFVRLGQEARATFSSLPGETFLGRVTYVYPTLDPKTRTAQIRMEFHNPGLRLKPGMFATVAIESELAASATLVAESAVLRSGDRTTVFIAREGGKFEPRDVLVGARDTAGSYEVLHGLTPGEKVVTSAQFMLDSESQLREAIQKMLDPNAASKPSLSAEHAAMASGPSTLAPSPAKAFICPMPEHGNAQYDQPGKCPVCGMTLIPGEATAAPVATPTPPSASPNHAPGSH